jgi:hypothetical protein
VMRFLDVPILLANPGIEPATYCRGPLCALNVRCLKGAAPVVGKYPDSAPIVHSFG